MSRSAITTIKNTDPFGVNYRYHDQHVDDTQASEAFVFLRNGWHASYLTASDTWRVSTPSGLLRTYERVR